MASKISPDPMRALARPCSHPPPRSIAQPLQMRIAGHNMPGVAPSQILCPAVGRRRRYRPACYASPSLSLSRYSEKHNQNTVRFPTSLWYHRGLPGGRATGHRSKARRSHTKRWHWPRSIKEHGSLTYHRNQNLPNLGPKTFWWRWQT
jgi:hypothetical protein